MNHGILPAKYNEVWLIGNGDHHVVIPPMAAIRFIEAFFGASHSLDILRACITRPKRLGTDTILNKNFLSWTPSNHRLTQCIFKKARPLDGAGLDFDEEITSNVFKIIDSDRAALVIFVDDDYETLLGHASVNFGIKNPMLMANLVYSGPIELPYHNYVGPGVIATLDCNPRPEIISFQDHIALGGILRELSRTSFVFKHDN